MRCLAWSEPLEPAELATVVSALVENYDFVVLHLSDWRYETGQLAVHLANGIILCGLASKLAPMRDRLIWARGDRPVKIAELVTRKAGVIEQVA